MARIKTLVAVLVPALFLIGSGRSMLELDAKSRVEDPPGSGNFNAVTRTVSWDPAETAVIICDMWDKHWCPSASERVAELAPAINNFASAARERGMLIIHAPSDTMGYYRGHPARKNALRAPPAWNFPPGMALTRAWLDEREKAAGLPIEDSDGGCDVEVPRKMKGRIVWTRQIDSIEIRDEDAIADSGRRIWNLLEQRGIKNVLLVGVHTNMCVVGRPFGLRNQVRYGRNAMLVRDLTDSVYNPHMPPRVDHFTGTDLMVEHIEAYICPTILSTEITGRPAFRFKADIRSRPE